MFPIAPGVANGLTYVPGNDRFYALITRDSLSWFYEFWLNGQVGYHFDQAAISMSPWFGGSLEVTSPIEGERFVATEPVRLVARGLDPTGQQSWDSSGVSWSSDINGPLGTGSPTVSLSAGEPRAHRVHRALETHHQTCGCTPTCGRFTRRRRPSPEINRVLSECTIVWVDGAPGDPNQQWSTFPGFPFDQASGKPSRTA